MIGARAIALHALLALSCALFARALASASEPPPPMPASSELAIVGDPPVECQKPLLERPASWSEPIEWKLADGQLVEILKALSKIDSHRLLVPRSLLHDKVHVGTLPPQHRTLIDSLILSELRSAGYGSIESAPVFTKLPRRAPVSMKLGDFSPEDLDKAIRCEGNRCTVARKLVDYLLSNTSDLARAARIVPSIHDGKPNGFKLYAIRPENVFARIGLQNGDAIQLVNGYEMSSPDKALEVYTKLRTSDLIVIEGDRRGTPFKLELTIQ